MDFVFDALGNGKPIKCLNVVDDCTKEAVVIEAARNLAGLEGANSAEFDPAAQHPVIATMADQRDVVAARGRASGAGNAVADKASIAYMAHNSLDF